jgi:hypothetical protein
MKLHTNCAHCKSEISFWVWVSDRVELKKSNGDFLKLTCKKCKQTKEYEVDNLKARESKIALLTGFLIFVVGTPTILILMWDYIWEAGIYGIVSLLFMVLIPSIIYGIIK